MDSKKKKKKIIFIFLFLLFIVSIFFIYFLKVNKSKNINENKIEVLDCIEKYEYNLEDRDSDIYKENFIKLKDLLEKQNAIDYQEYAKYLASLFLIDLYTINNKVSKYDVGALEFIYPEEQEKFRNKVMDSIYKLVEDNSTNTRKQELPTVAKIELKDIENIEYFKEEKNLDGFLIKANIIYQKDLGYDKLVSITVVKEDEKLYVVNLTNLEN